MHRLYWEFSILVVVISPPLLAKGSHALRSGIIASHSLIGYGISMDSPSPQNLGKELSIDTSIPTLIPAKLRVAYHYDSYLSPPGEESMGWQFRAVTDIPKQELDSLPNSIRWNISDGKKMLLKDWRSVGKASLIGSGTGNEFTVFDKSVLYELIPNQKTIYLVFAKDEKKAIDYHISIGTLCAKYPRQFFDLTHPNPMGGCSVDPKNMPDKDKECSALAEQLKDLIKKELLTCPAAKKQYLKVGCGDLDC